MPTYRVYLNEKDTGQFVTASNQNDAYFDVASSTPLTYQDSVYLEPIDETSHAGNATMAKATDSVTEQQVWLEKPEN